ncbi:hypothetical protein J3459_016667 [Metarhizium acridum]|nr:hypothetical protein J3459_016667 [Metarhizium acridum]
MIWSVSDARRGRMTLTSCILADIVTHHDALVIPSKESTQCLSWVLHSQSAASQTCPSFHLGLLGPWTLTKDPHGPRSDFDPEPVMSANHHLGFKQGALLCVSLMSSCPQGSRYYYHIPYT